MGIKQTYTSISLPSELVDIIDEIVEKKEFGYASRPEFLKDCVRRRISALRINFNEVDSE